MLLIALIGNSILAYNNILMYFNSFVIVIGYWFLVRYDIIFKIAYSWRLSPWMHFFKIICMVVVSIIGVILSWLMFMIAFVVDGLFIVLFIDFFIFHITFFWYEFYFISIFLYFLIYFYLSIILIKSLFISNFLINNNFINIYHDFSWYILNYVFLTRYEVIFTFIWLFWKK